MANEINLVALSDYERLLYNITKLGDENVIGIAILDHNDDCASSNQNIIIDEALLKMAMFYMYKRHPLFRAYVKEDINTNQVYFKFPDFDEEYKDESQLTVYTSTLDDVTRLTDELEAFNCLFFNYKENCLLWRLKFIKYKQYNNASNHVINRYAIALVLPFFITDGINVNTLCVEITNIINCLLTNQICDEMQTQLDLIDNLHQLIEKHNLFIKKHQNALETYLKCNKNVFFNLPGKFKNLIDKGLKITLLPLDFELSQKLIEQCKQRNLKVTGLLIAAAIYALKQLYEENGFYFPRDFSIGIPANLRIRLQPNVDFSHTRYCVLLTHLDLFYPKIGTFQDIWADAEYINDVLAERLRFDTGTILEVTHDFENIELGHSAFQLLKNSSDLSVALNSYKNYDMSFSNLGTYVYDRKKRVKGPLKLSEIYHGDSIATDPHAFCSLMMHCCTWEGRLMFQLSSSRKTIAVHYTDQFINLINLVLEKSLIDPKIF